MIRTHNAFDTHIEEIIEGIEMLSKKNPQKRSQSMKKMLSGTQLPCVSDGAADGVGGFHRDLLDESSGL